MNKVVRAIGSFIVTCILFACPITTAFMLQTKHTGFLNFLEFVLLIVSIFEFVAVLGIIYFHSEEV